MISAKIEKALQGNSVIRSMFNEGRELAAKIGDENVFDFSLGNPATPAPGAVNASIVKNVQEMDALLLHGYMSNAGYEDVRETIAQNLNQRFSTSFSANNLIMTVGAAGGLNIILKTLLNPGDEVICFVPYFGEYNNYVNNFDGVVVKVQPNPETFEPDLSDLQAKLSPKTKALIINTPNNPTGVVYSEAFMKSMASILEEAEKKFGQPIYLISDEPYRELVYDGRKEDFLTKYYKNTIVGYSFSKSLSLPGERIGYVVIPDEVEDADKITEGATIANRILGFVNAPSLMQKAVAESVEEKTNLAFYDKNRINLYEGLTKLGYTCIKPQGAFYLWLKSPVEDEEVFVQAGKKHNIIMVNGSAFSCPGYVRLAYCISNDKINRSLEKFALLAKEFGL
ncbi:MAG: pyridoxal phosphate-dependent aminotransferase [Lachnospiraceae bacterium]